MTSEELADLAFDIADEASVGVIESCTTEIEIDGETWLDFVISSSVGRSEWEDCENNIEYLEARGLLHRQPDMPGLVRIEEGARG